jgi:hypothetical protein
MSELLRLGTANNFQGEEAKAIIISLVRSNKNKKIGSLKIINRINVLLSRAQHGLYLIRNSETYSNIKCGKVFLSECEQKLPAFRKAFNLCCPRHRKNGQLQQVTTKNLFCKRVRGRPFGACNHTCPRPCHIDDCGSCPLPCEVRCPYSKCILQCSQACDPCVEKCTWHCEHRGKCSMPCAASCERLPCNVRRTKLLTYVH